jgi:integrase
MRNGLRVNHGLHVTSKRLASGTLRWYVYPWRGAGVAIYTCDGAKPAINKAMLDDAAEARKEARAAPENTLARLIADYKASPQYIGRAESTLRDYRRNLDRIADKFGDAPLEIFNDWKMRGNILGWRDEWQGQPRTADKLAGMFSILLQWGKERGQLTTNIALDIKSLHSADRSEIVWDQSHWDAIEPHASVQLMEALELDRMIGFRLSDLVKVGREHDLGRIIRFKTAKRKRIVVVPVFPELRAFLDRLKAKYGDEGPILRNSYGKPWTASGLGGVYQKAKNKAGIDVHIHDLRGTYVTWLCVKGLTDQEIAKIVGWSESTVAEIRLRYVDEARVVHSIVERLSA